MNPRRRRNQRQRRKWIVLRWGHADQTFVGYYRRRDGNPHCAVTTAQKTSTGEVRTTRMALRKPFRTDTHALR